MIKIKLKLRGTLDGPSAGLGPVEHFRRRAQMRLTQCGRLRLGPPAGAVTVTGATDS